MKEPEAGGDHYGVGMRPWDLQKHMTTWGGPAIDARRCDVIKYVFRDKGNIDKKIDDTLKAIHCLDNLKSLLQDIKKHES